MDFSPETIAVIVGIFVAAVAVFKGIAKLTKTTKDDEVAEILEDVADALKGEEK